MNDMPVFPEHLEVHETLTSWYWFDEDGILWSYNKPIKVKPTPEESQPYLDEFESLIKGKKVKMILDTKNSLPSTKEERQLADDILKKYTAAMALIIHQPMVRMLTKLFVGLQQPPYPIKMFKPGEESEAKQWLLEFKD